MTAEKFSAVLLFVGAVCFVIGAAINLWLTMKGGT